MSFLLGQAKKSNQCRGEKLRSGTGGDLKGKKFKGWLNGINPDEKLLEQYLAEVSKEDWIAKLSKKSLRWLTMTGVKLYYQRAFILYSGRSYRPRTWSNRYLLIRQNLQGLGA